MARAEVPDTTYLIQVLRDPDEWPAFQRALAAGRLWLSSVAVAELFAGTRSSEDAQAVNRIVAAMQRIDRVLTPSAGDWSDAGRLVARRIRLHGALRPRDHLADVLLVASAARLRARIISANADHMRAWVRLARRAGLDVVLGGQVL